MEVVIDPKDIKIPEGIRNKWQNIVNILVKILRVPVALIMKVDFPNFTVFEAADSADNPFKAGLDFKLPAGIYCEKTMKERRKNMIPNALKDPEWDSNPSIPIGMISYLGFPICYPDKNIFGTPCVLDNKENYYSNDYEEVMLQFKDIIESHLELLWQKMMLEKLLERQRIIESQMRDKIEAIEKFNKICVDRELRIIDLKKKISKLEDDLKLALREVKRGVK